MIVAILIVSIGLGYLVYCIWDTARSKYRQYKEKNETAAKKNMDIVNVQLRTGA